MKYELNSYLKIQNSMLELGDDAEYWHRYIGKMAKDLGVDLLYCCGEFGCVVVDAFGDGGFCFDDRDELFDALLGCGLTNKHIILIKGSHGTLDVAEFKRG